MAQIARNRKSEKSGNVQWKTGCLGERIPYAACVDGGYHRYLTADISDLEKNPPKKIENTPASCPRCGHASSELKGAKIKTCEECQWDAVAEHIAEFSKESGIDFMPSADPQWYRVKAHADKQFWRHVTGRSNQIGIRKNHRYVIHHS